MPARHDHHKPKGHKTMINNDKLLPNANWQTKQRGTNDDEYQVYLDCADDGNGNEFMTGEPLKTYDEWLNS